MAKAFLGLTSLALLASMVIGAGCAEPEPPPLVAPTTSALLFGRERSAPLATQMGRSNWPSTEGAFESPQDTYFVEYYRDTFGGNLFNEQNYPRRQFTSYRVGTTQK